jgi:hypothetical protein
MPVAITGILVLVLGSLSMQSTLLQARRGQSLARQTLEQGDRLASGAQRLVALLQGPASCLKPIPSSQWAVEDLPLECPATLDLDGLRSFSIDGQQLELVAWSPSSGVGDLELKLADQSQSARFQITPSGVRERG